MYKHLLRTFVLPFVLCATFAQSKAQWAPISTVFKTWLVNKHNVPSNVFMQNGTWFMDTTSIFITNDTSIVFNYNSGDHVDDIEGIQYFDNLKYLSCRNQGIDSLPPLPLTLVDLYAPVNTYRSIPPIPNVRVLHCHNTKIRSLPALSNALTRLSCYSDSLTSLTALPNSLTYLDCSRNKITQIPPLPDSLLHFDCSYNPGLQCLPPLKKIVTFIFISTGISCVPNYPQAYVSGSPDVNTRPICDSLPFNPCSGLPVPIIQNICLVTVDSNSTHTVVQWEKTNREATDSFRIYREVSGNVYALIGAVPGDSLSEYHDYTANPNTTGYRYKISVLDTAGTEGAVSVYHNTIHLQSLGGGSMQWTEYLINGISPVTTYDVYYDTAANGNWQLMLTVPGSQTTATDVNYANHPLALYRLAANVPFSCTTARSLPAVLSNSITIQPTGIQNYAALYFKLSPNPASDKIFIEGNREIKRVNIYNMLGEVVMTVSPATLNCQLSTAALTGGVYFVTIENKIGKVTKRLLIK